ncbi:hypothetical protein KMA67_14120 [Enterococcus durans]|uniref:hypothetical protein n=2 Tax=Enterococcus durans TaxID=53345 RepID=UPI001D0BB8AA|nr:hypothetical protein [Enterococcus durans]MCB8506806.1 hypothetical protein [Enterococcus durans]HAQ4394914.1 hypothetical protein [Enterococcus faecium]HAQ4451884.1 hypothetical protein [Enterococcus faecium]HAQ4700499.1 hypothetical protein [Enterococcus faecium]
MNSLYWKEMREKAIENLAQAKQKKNDAACKTWAWEMEFWGNIGNLEGTKSKNQYSYKWLQNRTINSLISDERYFTDLAKKHEVYSLIPIRIRELLDEQRRISKNI